MEEFNINLQDALQDVQQLYWADDDDELANFVDAYEWLYTDTEVDDAELDAVLRQYEDSQSTSGVYSFLISLFLFVTIADLFLLDFLS